MEGIDRVDEWNIRILDKDGNLYRTFNGKDSLPDRITWNGVSDTGEKVTPLEQFLVQLEVIPSEADINRLEKQLLTDSKLVKTGHFAEPAVIAKDVEKKLNEAVRESRTRKSIVTPAPSAKLKIDEDRFTPDGDGINDVAVLKPSVDGVEEVSEWSIIISDSRGNPFRVFTGKGNVPEQIMWDGLSDSGAKTDSLSKYIARLIVQLSEKDCERTGLNYLTDSGNIRTGVLVQAVDEEEWKIIVNTIYFDPDRATFRTLSKAQIDSNNETVKSIADQLLEHPNVLVVVEGYANNVSNTRREDIEELIPLSQKRADAIKNLLIERGVPADVISAVGKGGANPVAAWEDRANWWKNRRVEFLIRRK